MRAQRVINNSRQKMHNLTGNIETLRKDLGVLKEDIAGLAQNAVDNGAVGISKVRSVAETQLRELQSASREKLGALEDQIRARPGQSLAVAFAVGAVLALLMGRR